MSGCLDFSAVAFTTREPIRHKTMLMFTSNSSVVQIRSCPNGAMSSSPGLRPQALPWVCNVIHRTTPKGLCRSRPNPPQPLWGCHVPASITQGSSFAATLGFDTLPRWGKRLHEQPNEGIELARAMKGIKGVSARKINQSRGTSGHVWQDEYWDRIVRDDNELQEKMHYMFNNPIKKGLCADTSHWCGWVIPEN